MAKHELLFILCSYLLGTIPIGFILYYLTEKKDIRKEGSGNIGATNVLRTKGKSAGSVTLALDIAKGLLPVLYGLKHFDSPIIVIAGGAAVILGHLFPLCLKFKGGKGIAAFIGVFLVFDFRAALIFAIAFLFTLYFIRYVSASSIAGVIAVFFFILFTQVVEVSMIVFLITTTIILKHHGNIRRMVAGTENKLTWKHHE